MLDGEDEIEIEARKEKERNACQIYDRVKERGRDEEINPKGA